VTVLKQAAALLAGFLAAAIMVGLGIWQLNKYHAQGTQNLRDRAAASPVALHHVAKPGHDASADAFYHRVRLTGHYDNSFQQLLPAKNDSPRQRVVSAFVLDSGGAVAVVRGTTDASTPPRTPSGRIHQTGIFLPSEGAASSTRPGDKPTTLNLSALTQSWKPRLVGGFVTLSSGQAHTQSLKPAHVDFPSSSGRLRNGAYALQWWVFAMFAIAMAIKMAHDIGIRATQDDPDDTDIGTADGSGGGSNTTHPATQS
jgi:cytochrome oxidase assembly protein ShyY1